MKKLLTLLLTICLLAPAAAFADNNKQLQKALNKEKKEKMKEFKKEGWKLYGSTRSLEVALLQHYDKLSSGDAREIAGVATRCKSKSVGHQMAVNDACINYARQAGSQLKGRVVSDMRANDVDPTDEFNHFYAAYESQVKKEIEGEMEESFSIIRENSDGTYELQSFFVISEDAASKARVRAMNNAMKESEAAQRHAQKISDFVNEKVDNN